MSSYNAINGVFSSENRWLLTELLREEWGYDGLVVSDWGAVKDRVEALRAGLDLEMPGTGDEGTAAIVAAVRAGTLDRALVDASLERLRRLADRTAARPGAASFDADAHHALARRAAAASAVLLRNEGGTLPLRAGQRVAVVGGFAVEPQIQGGGSSHVNPTRVDSRSTSCGARWVGPGDVRRGLCRRRRGRRGAAAEARSAAAAADVAVVFAGLVEAEQSEGSTARTSTCPPGTWR
jgi:beta-glucosidase-like glycosyl hydrolase